MAVHVGSGRKGRAVGLLEHKVSKQCKHSIILASLASSLGCYHLVAPQHSEEAQSRIQIPLIPQTRLYSTRKMQFSE